MNGVHGPSRESGVSEATRLVLLATRRIFDTWGSAVLFEGNILNVLNSTFSNNKGLRGGAIALMHKSTGLPVQPDNSDVFIIGSQFVNNSAVKRGGAIYVGSGMRASVLGAADRPVLL